LAAAANLVAASGGLTFPAAGRTLTGMKPIQGFGAAVLVLIVGTFGWAAETPGWLIQLGIEPNNKKLTTQFYNEVVQPDDLKKGVGHFVAETDRRGREHAAKLGKSPNSIANFAGTWMEYSLMAALLERGKKPLFWQAEFKEIPNNFYDIVFFTKEHGPVVLSPKTSLRERYKQADLEALALRGLFPASRFYLLSLDPNKKHIANVQRKIASGEVRGIRSLTDETNMDELFKELDAMTVIEPEPGVLRSGRRIPGKP
jgi:hypothetical protein